MNVDPAASMRVWAVDVELGGRTFTVPALPASEWFPVLVSMDPLQILDMVVSTPGEAQDVDALILAGAVTGEEIGQALMDAIEEVTGWPPMAAFTLAYAAHSQWPIVNGFLSQRGFRWDVMPIGAALNAVYALLISNMDKDARQKFETFLNRPMPGAGRRRSAVNLDDFEAMAGPKPEGVRSSGAPSDSGRPRTRPRPRPPHQAGQSTEPTPRRAPRARNDRPASSGTRPAEAEPTS